MDTEAIAAFDLLSRMRFACGDDGKRMQDELEEYLRGLKRDAERYRWLRQRWGRISETYHGDTDLIAEMGEDQEGWLVDADSLDAAIDVAMNCANT